MRVRCTRGLSIHTFHGNFFVRSTDLLSLPNVNPDSGFGMQITYEESLADVKTVCFQAALLYTSSKAERRIRVHTICLPVTESLTEVMHSADQQCIVGLLSKMAVDRSLSSNLSDARDAFINATVDVFSAFKIAQNLPSGASGLVAPQNLGLLPLYILALLKQVICSLNRKLEGLEVFNALISSADRVQDRNEYAPRRQSVRHVSDEVITVRSINPLHLSRLLFARPTVRRERR